MKKNYGFSSVAVVLVIIIVLLVGGVAYYLGTKNNSAPQNVVQNPTPQPVAQNEQAQNSVNQNLTNCGPNSPSTIKVISPNGGEVYNAGQKITIKWASCNVTPNSIGILLIKQNPSFPYMQSERDGDYAGFTLGGFDPYKGTADDGVEEVTLPTNADSNLISGQHYFISINGLGDATHIGSGYVPGDYSDSLFTINSSSQVSAKLTSFTGSNGMFSAQSFGLTAVKIYDFPTGTEITQPSLFGLMNLVKTSVGGLQTWSLSAGQGMSATNIYAVGYVGTQEQNKIDYPYIGVTDIYNHLY